MTGRLPPQNLLAEESLLGAMLLSGAAVDAAVPVVTAADFYSPAHQHLFDAISAMRAAGEPIDAVTAADRLARAGLLDAVGGPGRLVGLMAGAPAVSNAAAHAALVADLAAFRRLVSAGADIAEIGYGLPESVVEAAGRAQALLDEAVGRVALRGLRHAADILTGEALGLLEDRSEGRDPAGVDLPWAAVRDLLPKVRPGQMTVVAARTRMGKSSFAADWVRHAAVTQRRVCAVFSLEMTGVEVVTKLVQQEGRIDGHRIESGDLSEADWTRINDAAGRVGDAPIYIDESTSLTVADVEARCRRLRADTGDLGLVVVDHVGLMTAGRATESRNVEVAEVSRGLKNLAKNLDTAVVALSQVGRQVDDRADKRPGLGDLSWSTSLEQDANQVLILFRPEVYEPGAEAGLAEVIVEKNRGGATGTRRVAWLSTCTSFRDMARVDADGR